MFDGRDGSALWLSNQTVRLRVLNAPPLSACSADFLTDRFRQLLSKDGGSRLKQRHVGCHEAESDQVSYNEMPTYWYCLVHGLLRITQPSTARIN